MRKCFFLTHMGDMGGGKTTLKERMTVFKPLL